MDGGLNVGDLPRLRCKGGRYYHIFRGTCRRLAAADEPDLALARYRELEAILADMEERLDAAAGAWPRPARARSGPRGPQSDRPYPPRMPEKDGRLYHVFRNKWRPLGPAGDFPAAMEGYRTLERDVVIPAKRARHGKRQRRGERPAAKPPEPQAPANQEPATPCHGSAYRAPAWRGYYGGGSPAP